jgi:GDP-D-mannose dehydratase
MGRLAELGIEGDVEFVELELLEASNVRNVLRKLQPNEIYNLAAQASSPSPLNCRSDQLALGRHG